LPKFALSPEFILRTATGEVLLYADGEKLEATLKINGEFQDPSGVCVMSADIEKDSKGYRVKLHQGWDALSIAEFETVWRMHDGTFEGFLPGDQEYYELKRFELKSTEVEVSDI